MREVERKIDLQRFRNGRLRKIVEQITAPVSIMEIDALSLTTRRDKVIAVFSYMILT